MSGTDDSDIPEEEFNNNDDDSSKDTHVPVAISDEMRKSYLDYAMSVIVSRALPDVRDGLKPVHRRILYAMKEGGYHWNRPYRKSARVIGDVMGKYHPHGDNAIYDAMVRMAQPFSMSLKLLDGQGNFGSIDGDPPAAMRYTETKLAKVAQFLIDDIEKTRTRKRVSESFATTIDQTRTYSRSPPWAPLNCSKGTRKRALWGITVTSS